jgi:hypothetical protein
MQKYSLMLEDFFSHSSLIIVEILSAATEAEVSCLEWQAAWVASIQVTTTYLQLVDDHS